MQIKSENLVEHTGRLYYYDLLRRFKKLIGCIGCYWTWNILQYCD